MKISAVIPVYNEEPYVGEYIKTLLEQTEKLAEIRENP